MATTNTTAGATVLHSLDSAVQAARAGNTRALNAALTSLRSMRSAAILAHLAAHGVSADRFFVVLDGSGSKECS